MTEKKRYRAKFTTYGPVSIYRLEIPEIFKAENSKDAIDQAIKQAKRQGMKLLEVREIEA